MYLASTKKKAGAGDGKRTAAEAGDWANQSHEPYTIVA